VLFEAVRYRLLTLDEIETFPAAKIKLLYEAIEFARSGKTAEDV